VIFLPSKPMENSATDNQLGNVMALKGTDPTDDRVMIISSHLDSPQM
jgi:hypothetical protein